MILGFIGTGNITSEGSGNNTFGGNIGIIMLLILINLNHLTINRIVFQKNTNPFMMKL